MASRKGRVRPPVDAPSGGPTTGGRTLSDNSFVTAQEDSRGHYEQTTSVRPRPRQFRASMRDIAEFTQQSLDLADSGDVATAIADAVATIQTVRIYGKNTSGATMTRGEAVYISGSSGTNVQFAKAKADAESTSSKTLGLVETASIAHNDFGWVVTEGILSGANTASYAAGDALWLSPSTAGGLTTTKPVAPNHMVFIGYVVRVQSQNGEIYVNPQNGFEIQELHNVLISSPSNGQVLQYDSTTSLWKNQTVSGGGGSVSSSSTPVVDNALVRFDGTTGSVIQTSVVIIDDTTGNISGFNDLTALQNLWSPNVSARSETLGVTPRVRMYENKSNGTNFVSFQAPTTLTADLSLILPDADGTSGQVLKTNGSKVLSFGDVAIGNVSGLGSGVSTFLATPSSANLAAAVTGETGSGSLVFADTTTTAPVADKVLKWNGSNWVPGSLTNTTEFQFLVTSFSTGISGVQEIGSGVWKAAGAISFTAAYQNNSSMTGASIQISGTGVTPWTSALSLTSPYTSGTSAADTSYPTPGSGSYRTMTFTITATRGSETPTRSVGVSFGNRRFWGTSTVASSYTEAQIEALTNELTISRPKSAFSLTASTSYYVVYATPVLLGAATFTDNATGFAFSMTSPETLSITNASGYTENYYVYRSTYSGLQTVSIVVS